MDHFSIAGWPTQISSPMWNLLLSKKNELLGEFRWLSFIKDQVHEYIDRITGNRTYSTLVGVHVRMTDYHAHMDRKYGPSKIPGVNYFNKSMSYYRQKYTNPLFLVISNDMTWCQNTLNDSDVVFAGTWRDILIPFIWKIDLTLVEQVKVTKRTPDGIWLY